MSNYSYMQILSVVHTSVSIVLVVMRPRLTYLPL